jgi:multidrug efflux system membrane fusion protein
VRTSSLCALAAGALALAGCGDSPRHSKASPTSPWPVAVAPAQRVLESAHEEFMGTVTARSTADIEAKLQARVERIDVVLGSRVAKGDRLAQLDTREYSARVEQARAVAEQTALELTRFEALLAQKASTQQEYDLAKSRQAVALATLSEAETYLSYATVVAPFAGTVTRKAVEVGDLAVPGKPLFTLEESGAQRFVVSVPDSKLGRIAEGDSLSVSLASAGAVIRGRVEELSSSSDPISRTFVVKVSLPQVAGVHPGQFGRLLLPAGGDETLFIPRPALVKRGQLDLVYVVTPGNRALLRLVRVGRQFPDRLEVLSGLREGETVVTSGQRDLSDGDSVVVQP